MYLASHGGGRKGDLSRFIEEAVRSRIVELASDADYLVTGDRRAGPLRRGHVGRARTLTPTEFRADAID